MIHIGYPVDIMSGYRERERVIREGPSRAQIAEFETTHGKFFATSNMLTEKIKHTIDAEVREHITTQQAEIAELRSLITVHQTDILELREMVTKLVAKNIVLQADITRLVADSNNK